MKPLAESKTRLSDHLSEKERAELSAAMLASVLTALRDSNVCATIVVGGDERVQSIASDRDAVWMPDRFNDLNLAVDEAFRRVWDSCGIAAYLPGDLPHLTDSDVVSLMEVVSHTNGITICPAHDGGTNALVVPEDLGFAPRLGNESYKRHRELATELGIEIRELWTPGFELDVDTIKDLRRCLYSLPLGIQNSLDTIGEALK
ncbi:Phosphoenolpyruvate guanylyltransferase [Geodia barretti]|uniref:Phosphoenolpyruvate guanylyltransferase n=1 Tax=Geodia barretti TaxID=519541 RepID=A0AA35RLT0_GEOBA|nr:Phosphoenolpyruvate guanylyltransferase [Geodia barretti]